MRVPYFLTFALVTALATTIPLSSRPTFDGATNVTLVTGIVQGKNNSGLHSKTTMVEPCGLISAIGAVPIRREVRELHDSFPDTWNLYMLGLRELQMMNETNPTSFYQIMGGL